MAKPPSAEVFESYFQRADLDRDGKISGNEAVMFFQGSNLPKPVLARIWAYVDGGSGFLGRSEFYNALRLVTVAQSGRELTQDIVKAALYGPAATKIPPPQINLSSVPTANVNSTAPHGPQMGAMAPPNPSQNVGIRGQMLPPNMGMSPQFLRPPAAQVIPGGASLSAQGPQAVTARAPSTPGIQPANSNLSNLSLGARSVGAASGPTLQVPSRGSSPSSTMSDGFSLSPSPPIPLTVPKPPNPAVFAPVASVKQQEAAKDSKVVSTSANGFSLDSAFGEIFSATPPSKPPTIIPTAYSSNANSAVPASGISAIPSSTKQSDPFVTAATLPATTFPTTSSHPQKAMSEVKPNQASIGPTTSGLGMPSVPVGPSSSSIQSWPKLTPVHIQKYTKVFMEVDVDRDGKITGEEARKLFLSWKLPREVLKQVWDLSDQDADSMLSLREFCIALYLMERSREGRSLTDVLPDAVKLDPMLPPAGQPVPAYMSANWARNPGYSPTGTSLARPPLPPSAVRPPAQAPTQPLPDGGAQPVKQKSKVPVLEKYLVDQLSTEEQNALNTKFEEAKEADKKVENLEKEILESRQKIEFYRVKMQELVLYKSRCDNRLNEIMERASADKHEMESLAKKYEDKYKQVGDTASKLTVDEATFRDIQERKMGLYNAIVKMEQGGNVDGALQDRADRIQSDFDELVKALNERCKKYGLRTKPPVVVELPFGWQPIIQEEAADWDDDWDKFEDEGFTNVKDVNADATNTASTTKSKSNIVYNDNASTDSKSEHPSSTVERNLEVRSSDTRSDVGSPRSPLGSTLSGSMLEERTPESPSQDRFNKDITSDASPRGTEIFSDHGAAQATFSSDKFSDEHWPTFDMNDDADSVWGFGSKEPDFDQNSDRSFFSSSNLGLNPIRTTDSPRKDNLFQKKSSIFADSVPGTPLFNSSSPHFGHASEEHSFDSFSRFDSFSTHDGGLFPPGGTLTRFDSVRSTRESDRFTSFDDSDPFGSMGPFKSESQTSKHPDPFGSMDSFKSLDSQTSRRDSHSWSAF